MASFGRAMASLRRAGLVEVRHKWESPYLRDVERPPSDQDGGRSSVGA